MANRVLSTPPFDADNHRHESTEAPLEDPDEESVAKIMGGNLASLMNVADAVVG